MHTPSTHVSAEGDYDLVTYEGHSNVGTHAFRAPETLGSGDGSLAAGCRADMWALGVTLWVGLDKHTFTRTATHLTPVNTHPELVHVYLPSSLDRRSPPHLRPTG